MSKTIKVPKITFVVGDARADLITKMAGQHRVLRPLYGPEDATRLRPFVGAIATEYVERFTELMAIADAYVPGDEEEPR